MRTIEAFRQRHLDTLMNVLRRPGMFVTHDQDLELYLQSLLRDLCFIDGHDEELNIHEHLSKRQLRSNRGVAGVFEEALAGCEGFSNEIASVYAELAHRLGYLPLEVLVGPADWRRLQRDIRQFRAKDAHATDIQSMFGPPSFVVGGSYNRVLCYSAADAAEAWICLDCCFDPRAYGGGGDRGAPGPQDPAVWTHADVKDPLLRNVRVHKETTGPFQRGVALTPYGRRLMDRSAGA